MLDIIIYSDRYTKYKGNVMPAKVEDKRRRAVVTLMLTAAERQEARRAAEKAGLPLSQFLRLLTMAAIRRGETVGTARAA
jgi:hypothetical protein